MIHRIWYSVHHIFIMHAHWLYIFMSGRGKFGSFLSSAQRPGIYGAMVAKESGESTLLSMAKSAHQFLDGIYSMFYCYIFLIHALVFSLVMLD